LTVFEELEYSTQIPSGLHEMEREHGEGAMEMKAYLYGRTAQRQVFKERGGGVPCENGTISHGNGLHGRIEIRGKARIVLQGDLFL